MNRRLAISLATFALWTAITMAGARLITGGHGALTDLVKNGIGWHFVLACVLLLVVARWQKWSDLKLTAPAPLSGLKLAWLPMLYIVAALGFGIALGLPPAQTVFFILANTLLVGLSEELMFRGILLQAFRHQMPVRPAVLLTSLAFGAIHSLNVFTTGELVPALVQSCAAFLSGLIFIALRLRIGSLWPSVIVHALWDFATFLLATADKGDAVGSATSPVGGSMQLLLPVALVLPNALYGLWLMRAIGRTHQDPEK